MNPRAQSKIWEKIGKMRVFFARLGPAGPGDVDWASSEWERGISRPEAGGRRPKAEAPRRERRLPKAVGATDEVPRPRTEVDGRRAEGEPERASVSEHRARSESRSLGATAKRVRGSGRGNAAIFCCFWKCFMSESESRAVFVLEIGLENRKFLYPWHSKMRFRYRKIYVWK